MATDYQKPAKLYQLTSTNNVIITGATVFHGIYSYHNNVIGVTFNDATSLNIPANDSAVFPNPIPAVPLKLTAAGSVMVLYS